MTSTQLTNLIILADRCRKNGLIEFDEFTYIEQSINAAKKTVAELRQTEDQPNELQETEKLKSKTK